MAERPTAGYELRIGATNVVGIVQEFDVTTEGDTEDISGLSDVENGIVRRKGKPVDVGQIVTFSGKIDEDADGFSTFRTAMKQRTKDTNLQFLRNGNGWSYTGHSDSYNETASRSEGVWNFSATFYVNATATV